MFDATIALLIFLFPFTYSPGPGNMFFTAIGARFGVRSVVRANIGYHIANVIITLIIGFGLLQILDQNAHLFRALKFAGSLYILWVAWRFFRAGTNRGKMEAELATFMDGALIFLTNAKAYVSISLMFTQFLDNFSQETSYPVLAITFMFTLNNFIAFFLWAWIGDMIASRFASPRSANRLNLTFAGLLVAVSIWIFFS